MSAKSLTVEEGEYPDQVAIRVTASNIWAGVPQSSSKCAVALAIWDAFPRARFIDVGDRAVQIVCPTRERRSARYRLPEKVTEFIRMFDIGMDPRRLEPFRFKMRRIKAE